jgi:hypothetical protein
MSWGAFFNSQHLEGKKGVLELQVGDNNEWKVGQLLTQKVLRMLDQRGFGKV